MRVVKRSRRVRQAFLRRILSTHKNNGVVPRCVYCGIVFTDLSKLQECTMDHLVPLARGGRNNRDNLVPCCSQCNRLKGHAEWPRNYSNYVEVDDEQTTT